MNNYINIDKISASLMTAVYLIILASIATIINTSNTINNYYFCITFKFSNLLILPTRFFL